MLKLRIEFAGSVAKDPAAGVANEDVYLVDETRQRFCVADGAGESYSPALWAKMLSERWINYDGERASEQLTESVAEFTRQCNPESLSWSQIASFNRGTFTTLLGVRLRGDFLHSVAIGDSLLAISQPCGEVKVFPYDDAESFDACPELLSTMPDANRIFTRKSIGRRSRRWKLVRGSRVILMTDAIGRWLLERRANSEARDTLQGFRKESELTEFVLQGRSKGELRTDDCTLIHLIAD